MRKIFLLLIILTSSVANLNAQTQVEITGDITTNTTWTADKTYLLNGFVHVSDGATLTIEAGTTVYGKIGSKATLIVRKGGKLNAIGTATAPIVFTSEYTKPGSLQEPAAGDWGGIILLGKAPINLASGSGQIEGTGDINDTYGGTDPNDNSGTLTYVRIEYPGVAFAKDNEINGLTFGGVGAGTTIDYIQVAYSGDDSYEWFGGTVNCKHLVAYAGTDDDFDTDFGFQGKLQFLLGVRDPLVADQAGTSNGFESDNDGTGSLNTPRTSPTWWNVTLIGPKATSSSVIDSKYSHGMHLRKSSQNKISNTLIVGWAKDGVFADGTQTNIDLKDGLWWFKNGIVAGAAKSVDSTKGVSGFDYAGWFTSNNNRYYDNNDAAGLSNPFFLSHPNAMPKVSSPALTGGAVPPSDGFFDVTASYVGAFGTEDWTSSWSTIKMTPVILSTKEELSTTVIPAKFELSQNYPNPFNPATTIRFSLPQAGEVKLTVYNLLGQVVTTLVNGYREAGTYNVNWDASNLSTGVYIYRVEANTFSLTKKMTLLK